ncbi:MAG: hypothetical protein COX49_00825 [bacterium (Candidatus Stahlbacteria) CG23_combo_of_CG06-09_8_20_14_all_40_9]|nr:MAG: hypothetical protein COX49_00825 [bacterium (Candidatus Stahlbacteria) CG23_combo_of_CG06-09_8_20_14_all_40_9]
MLKNSETLMSHRLTKGHENGHSCDSRNPADIFGANDKNGNHPDTYYNLLPKSFFRKGVRRRFFDVAAGFTCLFLNPY